MKFPINCGLAYLCTQVFSELTPLIVVFVFPVLICLLSCGVGVGPLSVLRSVHMTGHGQLVMETSVQSVGMVQGQVTGGTITTLWRRSSDTHK